MTYQICHIRQHFLAPGNKSNVRNSTSHPPYSHINSHTVMLYAPSSFDTIKYVKSINKYVNDINVYKIWYIKPHVSKNDRKSIKNIIRNNGIKIIQEKYTYLSRIS